MKVFKWLKRKPIIRFTNVPLALGNKIEWYIRAEIQDFNLQFNTKREAEAYRRLLKDSRSKIPSKVERLELDRETGHIITYPPKEQS